MYIDTGRPVPNIPSKLRCLADKNKILLTEWKWFKTSVLSQWFRVEDWKQTTPFLTSLGLLLISCISIQQKKTHNFLGPFNEQSYTVWCPLVLWFQRRLKCKCTYDDQVDDGVWWLRLRPSDGNTSKTKLCRGTIIQWTFLPGLVPIGSVVSDWEEKSKM